MKRLPLTQGKSAIVDDEDFERLSKFKWGLYAGKYAGRHRSLKNDGVRGGYVYMHRELLKASPKRTVDHVNGNPLDNRKSNLRLATHAQNLRNTTASKNNKLGRKGIIVRADGRKKKFLVRITKDRKTVFTASFYSLSDAVRAHKINIQKLHGEFAKW